MNENSLELSRRSLFGAAGAALFAGGCGREDTELDVASSPDAGPEDGAAPDGVLGANFNENPTGFGFKEANGLDATWMRGFIAIRAEDQVDPKDQKAVAALLSASRHGYGTVLSLKFKFIGKPFPTAGSSEMDAVLARVDRVLDAAMGKVNILVVGNEPFIECRRQDWNGPLGDFYATVAHHVLAYRARHFPGHCRTRVYMGALTHLERPEWQSPGAEHWMKFVRETEGIEGLDVHTHVASLAEAKKCLDYVVPRLGPDQKFLVLEFSLVQLWREHLRDQIPARFAERYGANPDTLMWQAIKQAIDNPWPRHKWVDLLAMSPWYASNKHYLKEQVAQFRATGRLGVAAYGAIQGPSVKDFGPDKQPWLLNSLYANRTVLPAPGTATPAHSYGWFDDFRDLQRKQDRRPVNTGEVSL